MLWNRLVTGLLMVVFSITVSPVSAQGRGQGNCAATPDQILGQAFGGFAGAEGETGEGGLTPEGEDIVASGLAADAEWMVNNLPYSAAGPEPVVILIVDDFSSDGTGDIPISHGYLVMQVFNQLYTLLPPDVAASITLQPVNIADEAGYRSELILPEIQSAIEGYTAQGVNRFVLNMSFVFVPCRSDELGFDFAEVAERRRNDPEYSIVEDLGGDPQYVRSVLTDARISYIEADRLVTAQEEATPRGNSALQAAGGGRQIPPTPAAGTPQFRGQDLRVLRLLDNTNLQSDPLRDFLRQTRNLTIIPVASAGNFKQRQPFYPARWPEVISVSANEGNDLRFWLHSNNGDLSVPGAWYLFEDEAYRAGTSFAAPVVSLLIALDLTQTEPTCGVRGNSPVLARGSYDNALLADAVGQYC